MTTFLLLISLLLNGVAIFFIIILFTRQNRLIEVEKSQDKLISDVEEIITASLLEMKEENEAFIKKFHQVSSQSAKIKSEELGIKGLIDHRSSNVITEEKGTKSAEKMNRTDVSLKKQATKAYQNPSYIESINSTHMSDEEILSELKYDPNISERAARTSKEHSQTNHENIYRDLFVNQVLILKKQGYSTDDIAKKLSKGKTEIELLLKFGQNEQ